MENNNIIEIISTTINTIFSSLFSSIDNELYGIIDDIIFIDKSIITDSRFENIIGSNASEGILLICNALIIGFMLYYGISLLLSHLTFSENIRPTAFIFRLIIFSILLNFSPFICEILIEFISNISLAIRGIGETLFNKEMCFSSLIQELNNIISINSTDFNLFSLNGLLKGFISISLLNLIFTYSLRYIMIKIFTLLAPFAFLTLLIHNTKWFFYTWLKAYLSLLFMQILISLILVITFSFNFSTNDLLSKLLILGSIYAIIKANTFIKELMGGISTEVSLNINKLRSGSL